MNKEQFNEKDYLKRYPDVASAVLQGGFSSGFHHYDMYGEKEGRVFTPLTENQVINSIVGISDKLNMVDVPLEFQQVQNIVYPQGNTTPFERYFYTVFNQYRPKVKRTYLPIFWTSYYVNNSYGNDNSANKKLQKFIDGLPKDRKYFTIIQYDDGILNDISGLDILVYSMGNNNAGYYPLPLICQPTNSQPYEHIDNKDILFSFLGANTHPIREKLVNQLKNEYVTFTCKPHNEYLDILKRSVFALCPRGYGVTSFRLYEAMAYGCIPVYISDKFWEAFNLPFNSYGIKITENKILDIPNILSNAGNVSQLQSKGKDIYEKYFVYSSCADSIINSLK